jgi:DNA-binding transcriptional MocR family regulator
MNLSIDKQGTIPVYEQIRIQIEELVSEGLLAAGTRIPSVRQLALSLGLSKNTVSVAYEELAARHIIETKPGSGTFICARPEVATGQNLSRRQEMNGDLADFPPMRWESYFFRSEFFGMMPGRGSEQMIRFTHNYPDPALFPFERIKQVATNMLWNPQSFFFDISHPQGYQPLVEHLEREMALAGIPMAEGQNDIIITGGFQRALSLILDFIVRPGQKVAIESPSYSNLLNLLIAKRYDFLPVPMDNDGLDTEFLATALARGEVSAIICTPDFHNPTGISMSRERREHLLRLSMQYRVPIVEDDWGRKLRYEGEDFAPLKSMDQGGYVIHTGSYSKCFLPGLRIGWITCPAAISNPVLSAKMGADRGDSFFLQVLLHEFIVKGHFDRHLRKSNREYLKRRDAMHRALATHLPAGCRYRLPQGGFTFWIELPAGIQSMKLLELSRRVGVDFVPAPFMSPDRRDSAALRLSFSRSGIEEISSGVKTLCSVIANCLDNPQLLTGPDFEYEDLLK